MPSSVSVVKTLCVLFGSLFAYASCVDFDTWSIETNEIEPLENVRDNPDAHLPTPELIKKYGYPAETHTVKTEDGYLLNVHRIPYGRKSPPGKRRTAVFLQHGLLGTSADWVMAGPEKGLAYLLADRGYDVWLGNARGNTYSRNHVTLSPDSRKFWNFSWHEMGHYDLPAVVDYILKTTKQKKVFYVGHSMGTTMFWVLTATRPEYNDKIHAMFGLAPVAFLKTIKSPVRYLAPFANVIKYFEDKLGEYVFLPQSKIMRFLTKYGCEAAPIEKKLCENFLFLICGFDASEFNMTLLPVILGHSPAGTSTKTLVHYAQSINAGTFREFDYGEEENKVVYNKKSPPEYDLSNIVAPISLHYSDNDWLADPEDIHILYKDLPHVIASIEIPKKSFNHLDFLWSTDVKKLVYDKLIDIMKRVKLQELTNEIRPQEALRNIQKNLEQGYSDVRFQTLAKMAALENMMKKMKLPEIKTFKIADMNNFKMADMKSNISSLMKLDQMPKIPSMTKYKEQITSILNPEKVQNLSNKMKNDAQTIFNDKMQNMKVSAHNIMNIEKVQNAMKANKDNILKNDKVQSISNTFKTNAQNMRNISNIVKLNTEDILQKGKMLNVQEAIKNNTLKNEKVQIMHKIIKDNAENILKSGNAKLQATHKTIEELKLEKKIEQFKKKYLKT